MMAKGLLKLTVSLAAMVAAGGIQAQTSNTVEEVVVTATKRAENAKDVPISISVLGQEQLKEHNISGVEDLTRSVPGISFNAGGSGAGVGVGETNIEIRGISSSSGAATVGVYIGDVAVSLDNNLGAPMPMMFDLNRVEVLRGPQGTLFGAGSEGGTVRYIFNEAKLNEWSGELSQEVSGTVHGGINYQSTAVANIPVLTDKAAVRLNAGYASQSGWIDNYALDGDLQRKGVNDNQTRFARIAATLQPTDFLTLTPELTYQEIRSADTPVFYLQDTAYAQANAGVIPQPLASDGLYKQHKEVREATRDTMIVPSLTATANLGFADLTSVTSYYGRDYSRITDGTTYDSFLIAVDFLGRDPNDRVLATLPSPATQPSRYKTYSQELRLSSPADSADSPLKWTIGGYYSDQQLHTELYDTIPNLRSVFQSVYGYDINSAASPIGVPSIPDLYHGDNIYTLTSNLDTRQIAAFGQLDYAILPWLHAAAGLRITYADTGASGDQEGFIALGATGYYSNAHQFYSSTPKFSLVADVTDTVNLYSSVGKGFRLGGEQPSPLPQGANNVCSVDYANFAMSDTPSNSYNSDHLWSYEAGTKGRAFGNTLSFDVSGYYIGWKNIQQAILLPTCGYYDTVNVGDAEIYGTEIELRYKIPGISGLTLGVTGGATHAALTKSINPQEAPVGSNILYTPRWTETTSLDYAFPVTDAIDGFIRWDYGWTGPSNGSYQVTNPNYRNPAYGVMNVTVGADVGRWQVSLFVKNLLDDQTIIQSPTINSLVEGYTTPPLTAGMRASLKF
jgi:outer membrane receptor protein involved in Fe transport